MELVSQPDDSEINAALAEAGSLEEAIFSLVEKYEIPVTNNEPRWQGGQYIRGIGDFLADLKEIFARFPNG